MCALFAVTMVNDEAARRRGVLEVWHGSIYSVKAFEDAVLPTVYRMDEGHGFRQPHSLYLQSSLNTRVSSSYLLNKSKCSTGP